MQITSRDQVSDHIFEKQVFPGLFRHLHKEFAILPFQEREDAVQDGVCLAFETWRLLRLDTIRCREDAVADLARYASEKYFQGVRFAAV